MRFELSGVEAVTLELRGSLAAEDARRLLSAARLDPAPYAPGRVEVGLLVFEMRGLGLRGVPGPRFDYREALWRVGVLHEGERGWLGFCCDIDHALVRRAGALVIRYP